MNWAKSFHKVRRGPLAARAGFSLLEVLVVVSLLTLIMLGLLLMFNQTQRAFRSSMTQTDVLEAGRATTVMLTRELEQMTPSDGANTINFFAMNYIDNFNTMLMPGNSGAATPEQRTNVLETLYFLSRNNQQWIGTGYLVVTNAPQGGSGLGTLYHYTVNCPVGQDPNSLFTNYNAVLYNIFHNYYPATNANLTRIVDGVVHFTVRAYDTNGVLMATNQIPNVGVNYFPTPGIEGLPFVPGQVVFYGFTNNAVPAAVEFELGVMENGALLQLQAIPDGSFRSNRVYSVGANAMHLFRQRVNIPNVDITAYQ